MYRSTEERWSKDAASHRWPQNARTTVSTPTRFATVCVAISCRSAARLAPRFANDVAPCAIATCWWARWQMKLKISSLLMEAGVSHNKEQLHQAGYPCGRPIVSLGLPEKWVVVRT